MNVGPAHKAPALVGTLAPSHCSYIFLCYQLTESKRQKRTLEIRTSQEKNPVPRERSSHCCS